MFLLNFTSTFLSHKEKVIGNDQKLNKRLRTTLEKLAIDPKHPSLKTHKADTKNYGEKWSSWVTGDIRIIWDAERTKYIGNCIKFLLLLQLVVQKITL